MDAHSLIRDAVKRHPGTSEEIASAVGISRRALYYTFATEKPGGAPGLLVLARLVEVLGIPEPGRLLRREAWSCCTAIADVIDALDLVGADDEQRAGVLYGVVLEEGGARPNVVHAG